MLLTQYDDEKYAIINPDLIHKPIANFPKTAVSIFSKTLIEEIVNTLNPEIITTITNATKDFPVYKINIGDTSIALYQSPVGGPAAAPFFEEIIVMGAKTLLLSGNCGCLDNSIKDLSIIIPTSAIRDEGTSYHYLPESDEIEIDDNLTKTIESVMQKNNIHYTKGKTWTTDAIFRETKSKVELRKKQGAITVEMECASLASVAKFRNVNFAQILYAADNLASEKYDPRSLIDNGINDEKRKIISLILETAIEIDKKF